ncbi:MAG: hypothetical protein HRT74_13805, partial [Flavobacteriales bacterium]|nr:hypothetical protein [Flavobacteriales bacterium]
MTPFNLPREYYPFNDNWNFGAMTLDYFGDTEEFSYEIFDVETGITTEPTSINHLNSGVELYGFDAGEQCLRIYHPDLDCPQEICVDFAYDVEFEPALYEVIEEAEYFGDDFLIQLYIESDHYITWNTEFGALFENEPFVVLEEGEYFHATGYAESATGISCEVDDSNFPIILEYLPGFDMDYITSLCDVSADGEAILTSDIGNFPADLVLVEDPVNPDLEFEIVEDEIHFLNMNNELRCFQISSISNPDFDQEFCLQVPAGSLPGLPSNGNVVEDPSCGNSFDGAKRVSFFTFGEENLLSMEWSNYMPELDLNTTPVIEGGGLYNTWITGLGEGMNQVVGVHPSGCTVNWNINMDESGSGALIDVQHEIISSSEEGVLVSFDLELTGDHPWPFEILSDATYIQENEYLIPPNTEVTIQSCPENYGTICCDTRTISIDFQFGCTDTEACNFDPQAEGNDGSCEYMSCAACTDEYACNYDPIATLDDGSCEFVSCFACQDPDACNYDPNPFVEPGSCDYSCQGCTDDQANNYDPSATIDDGSCTYPPIMGDFDQNNAVNTSDMLFFLSMYGEVVTNPAH